MDSILSDEKPAPSAPPAPLDIPTLGDTPLPELEAKHPQSIRSKHRDKEQAAQGRVRDPETGQFATKEPEAPAAEKKTEEPAAPPKPAAQQQEFTDKEKAFLRAAQEERGKRQELERKIAAYEAEKAKATAEPEKTFWDDPEAALARNQEQQAKHLAEVRMEIQKSRVQTAESIARGKHTDYDEKIATFGTLIEQTPGLFQQWLADPDPAEFAYRLGKNHMDLQQAGSIDGLRAQIEKETRIKLEGELKAKSEAFARERAALPSSLSDARSTGVNRPVWGGPLSMDDILKG